jgi:hypothetical protein
LKKYSVTWYLNVAKIGKSVVALGICEKTKCVSHIAIYQPNKPIGKQFLKTLIIQDVLANGECEDGHFCLNLECPLNGTDLTYWKKFGVKTEDDLRKLHKVIEQVKVKLNLKVEEHGKQCYFEKPPLRLRKTRH